MLCAHGQNILLLVSVQWPQQHTLTHADHMLCEQVRAHGDVSPPGMKLLSPVTIHFLFVLKSFSPLVYFPKSWLRKIITNIPPYLGVLSRHSKRLHGKSITDVWISSPVSGKFVVVIVDKYFQNYFKHFGCLALPLGFDSLWALFSLGIALLFILKLSFLWYLDKEISMITDKQNIVNQTGLNNIFKNVSILFPATVSDYKLFKHGYQRILKSCDLMIIMTHFSEIVSFWVELIHL